MWRLIPREGFGELTCDPFGSRVCRHIDPDQVSPVEPDDDEGIEQVKVNGREAIVTNRPLSRKGRRAWQSVTRMSVLVTRSPCPLITQVPQTNR